MTTSSKTQHPYSPDNSDCGCSIADTSALWTPIPEQRQPTDILPGENIDCYSARGGNTSGLMDDARQEIPNRIANTKISADRTFKVDETFTLTPGARTATSWTASSLPAGVSLNESSGQLKGTVDSADRDKTFKITIAAADASGTIDSREFTFFAGTPKKGDSISLIIPYRSTNGQTPRVTSPFGPRMHPIWHTVKNHTGQDWAGGRQGDILAAADGEVVFAGFTTSTGYGNQIRINHFAADGSILCQTTYSHLSQIIVTKGQKVGQGQMIGKEGSTGASTGPHLHFEVLLGGKQYVDPAPYINGTVTVDAGSTSEGASTPEKTITNTAAVMTKGEVTARTTNKCPVVIGNPPTTAEPGNAPTPSSDYSNKAPYESGCAPAVKPTYAEVSADIDKALNEDASLDADDKKLIRFIAQIESRYDPYAKNPTSSATGLYQMLDSIAVKYYGQLGIPPTCSNRCNAYYATQAMIAFYKKELKTYYDGYISSNRSTIAGKQISVTAHSQRYPTLSKGEFIYGLLHHDGVGNAVRGIDLQGVDYYRKKIRETAVA